MDYFGAKESASAKQNVHMRDKCRGTGFPYLFADFSKLSPKIAAEVITMTGPKAAACKTK